jgi:hypothetical protein
VKSYHAYKAHADDPVDVKTYYRLKKHKRSPGQTMAQQARLLADSGTSWSDLTR